MRRKTFQTVASVLKLSVVALALITLPLGAPRLEAASPGSPGEASYFPLQAGNEWTYQRTTPGGVVETFKTAISEPTTGGGEFFQVTGYFGMERTLKSSPDGGVIEVDTGVAGSNNLWYLMDAAVGKTWRFTLAQTVDERPPECLDGSLLTMGSRTEKITVPAGSFNDVLRIDFQSPCFDAGVRSEWFAPGVGLVRRTEDSIAGEIVTELVRARIDGHVLPSPVVTATLSLDRVVYEDASSTPGGGPAPELQAVFTIANPLDDPIAFSFPGCPGVDLEVIDETGAVVAKAHGEDADCVQQNSGVTLVIARDSLVLRVSLTLAQADGRSLLAGRYAAVAKLDTIDPQVVRPRAVMTFQIIR